MTKFADQLYADLMRQHGSVLAATRPPAPSRRHIASRGALVATGAGGLAVAATAGVLVTGGGTPAYALTTNHDDTITLAVYQESGITQANARLRQLGDNVVVVPVRPGCPSLSSLPAPALPAKGKISVQSTKSSDGSITVNARGVPAGDILVIAAEITAHGREMGASLTSPPAPSCVSLLAPPSGNGGPGSGAVHDSGSVPNVSSNGPLERTGCVHYPPGIAKIIRDLTRSQVVVKLRRNWSPTRPS
jgi:hypothetical protein